MNVAYHMTAQNIFLASKKPNVQIHAEHSLDFILAQSFTFVSCKTSSHGIFCSVHVPKESSAGVTIEMGGLGYGDFDNRGLSETEMGNNLPFVNLGSQRNRLSGPRL